MIRDVTRTRRRSGITLVEILISIAIMGIGVISIATLFPLGLIRLRNAQRLTRGAYLVESATADLGSRNLLSGSSFFPNPYYQTNVTMYGPTFYNPLFLDTSSYGAEWGPAGFGNAGGANRYLAVAGSTHVIGAGLPVCYDPLWRGATGSYADPVGATTPESRFGSGIGFVRGEGGTPAVPAHAHGLQRVSNFQTLVSGAHPLATVSASRAAQLSLAVQNIFISPEDVTLQERTGDYLDPSSVGATTPVKLANPSPIVPALSESSSQLDSNGKAALNTSISNDWRYTWFFTGQQADASSTAVDGEIVICENRPFGIDVFNATNMPAAGSYQVSGETVVEAIWGFSSSPNTKLMLNATQGYASQSASRSVYLRWPNTMPDPDVRVGGWIADVTYERVDATARSHYGVNGLYPAQRCFWYQVAKKSDVADDPSVTGYRQMTVWTTAPLRAMTLLTFTAGAASAPVHIEAALIMPSVVNVYSRTIYTR